MKAPLLALLLIPAALLVASCKPQDTSNLPDVTFNETTILESGTLVHAFIFSGPSTQTDRQHVLFLGGKITIYSNDLVVITDTAGIKHAAPLEWCSDLEYK
jgi:hypothetical protein